ncbi:MAG: esterase [Campylobacterales bacterium]|nr:esterase [Campylobacterales bacterium]
MILYIHGYGGHGLGVKSSMMREYCKSQNIPFLAPSLSYIPDLAIQTLEEILENLDRENLTLVGSSLGGFYSIYLAHKYNLKAVLINPSIYPYETLLLTKGHFPHYYDGSTFEWNDKHINSLFKYEVKECKDELFLLLLQKGDETLDYSKAMTKFPKAKMIIEEGGSHSFDGFERHFKTIVSF